MSQIETSTQTGNGDGFHVGGRLLARNTAINLGGRVVPLLVAILAMPYVIRLLGPDRFGLLSLAWVVVGYFAVFNLGIGPATTKFVAELLGRGKRERLPELVWTAIISQTCLGIVGGILLAAAAPLLVDQLLNIPLGLHGQARMVFLILAIALPVDFASGSLRGVLGASQRFDLLNIVSIPSGALTYMLPVVALALGYGLPLIVLLLVLARVAALIFMALFCLRLYPTLGRGIHFSPRLVWKLLGFGGWVTVSGAIIPVLNYLDRLLIGSLISVAAIGFYTPPFMIATKISIIPGSLMATLFPAFSTSAGRGDREWTRTALLRSLKYLILTVGPATLVLVFFARPILSVWLGGRFASEGTTVLQILAVGVFISSLDSVPYDLLQATGRPDLTAKFHLAELPVYACMAWFLVTRFGLPGAALAWTIRAGVDFLLLIVAACWLTGTTARMLAGRGLRRGAGSLLVLAVGFVGVRALTGVFATDVALALFLVGGFLFVAWRYVLEREERWRLGLWLRVAR